MKACELCHEDNSAPTRLCASCLNWRDYWIALTAEERDAELKMMDRYAVEGEHL